MNDDGAGPGMEPPRTKMERPRLEISPLSDKMSALNVDAYLADPARKQQFVTPMFDTIAPRYDAFTRLFSFGMDARWKRVAIEATVAQARRAGPVHRALDLACGTGDLAIAIARQFAAVQVRAIDASPRMIDEARARLAMLRDDAAGRVSAAVGDMTALDVADNSVDLITAGYGVRNVPDYARALDEMARVTRRGGTLVTLDFYRPRNVIWRSLLLNYLAIAGNTVGWLWHRDPVIYGYIAKSIEHFVSWQEFSRLLTEHGFRVERVRRFLGGGIAVHVCTRV